MESRICKKCNSEYPLTRDFFGQNKNKNEKTGMVSIVFRHTCRKCMAANTKKHTENNPELAKARFARRQEIIENAKGKFYQEDIEKLWRELDEKCRYCESLLDVNCEVDHLTPLSRGGTDYPRNLTLCCSKCNKEKLGKTRDEYILWRKERGLFVRDIITSKENPDKPNSDEIRKIY